MAILTMTLTVIFAINRHNKIGHNLRIALLILATFIWGAGFVGTRWTLIDYSPIWSNSLRFIFAGVLVLPWLIFKPKLRTYKGVIICSLLLLIALQLQTYGIKYTSMAKAGFLTTFYAIFTPVLSYFFQGKRFRLGYWGLVTVAIIGIGFLCDLELSKFNKGDLYILSSALFFSIHILAIDKYGQLEKSVNFNLWQCFYVSIFGALFAFAVEGPVSLAPLFSLSALTEISSLWGFIILSLFSSIIAFSIQVYAQKETPPHIVSLIFLMESVFSTIFGMIFFHEMLNFKGYIGAGLVLLSVALIPIATKYKKGP